MVATLERTAARLFSTAAFRPVLSGRDSSRTDSTVRQLGEMLCLNDASRGEIVESAYGVLSDRYRSEYLYRNLITSKYFVGRHRAANSVLLHELSIGSSIADCVLINGAGTVYEIKTEYDDASRLETQIADYRKAFPIVNLVINESDVDKYLPLAKDNGLGVVALSRRGHLSVRLAAREDRSSLDLRSMFNILRVSEVQNVLCECVGAVPDVPNGRRYAAYLQAAQEVPVRDFQFHMQRMLKARASSESKPLLFEQALFPLRAIISQLNPSKQQQLHLRSWLNAREGAALLRAR